MILEGTYPTQGEYPDSSHEYRGSAKVSIHLPRFSVRGDCFYIFIENLYVWVNGGQKSLVPFSWLVERQYNAGGGPTTSFSATFAVAKSNQ